MSSANLSQISKNIRNLRKKLKHAEKLQYSGKLATQDTERKELDTAKVRKDLQKLVQQQNTINGHNKFDQSDEAGGDRDVAKYTEKLEVVGPSDDSPHEKDMSEDDATAEEKMQTNIEVTSQVTKLQDGNNAENGNNDDLPTGQNMKTFGQDDILKESHVEESKDDNRKILKSFRYKVLEGHNDIILCVHFSASKILTGSRDTMVKLWSSATNHELNSFGGHTGAVTHVQILSQHQSISLVALLNDTLDEQLKEKEQLGLSCGDDCCLKIWGLTSGLAVKSIYVYNPVTCFCIVNLPGNIKATIGTESGKIEMWDLVHGSKLSSLQAYNESVTSLTSHDNYLYSSSKDGQFCVHVCKTATLSALFCSNDVSYLSKSARVVRPILSLCAEGSKMCFGDEGRNVKVFDWKEGTVQRLRHQLTDFGVTDVVCMRGGHLFASGYNIDRGQGYINIWTWPELEYIGTLMLPDCSRILTMSIHDDGSGVTIVTGGDELIVWQQSTQDSKRKANKTKLVYVASLQAKAVLSEDEDDELTDVTDDEEDKSEEDSSNSKHLTSSTTSLRRDVAKVNSMWEWLYNKCNIL